MTLTKAMLTAFKARWETVADVERAELRSLPLTERWRQLNALVRMGAPLVSQDIDLETRLVDERWREL